MSRPVEHNVRGLESQRRRFLAGKSLPSETYAAVERRAKDLARGRGGLRKCNGVERHLYFDMALVALIRDAVLDEVDRRGTLFTDEGALLPVFTALATFLNTGRLHAMALGIKPDVASSTPSLDAYLAKKAKKATGTNARANGTAEPTASAALPTSAEPSPAAIDAAAPPVCSDEAQPDESETTAGATGRATSEGEPT